MKGQRVCLKHGGASPQAKRKAQLRLAELVSPAIATLAREMANADKSSDKQRAANSILDRAGVPRSVTSPDGEAARDLLLERLYQLREQQGLPGPLDDDEDDEDFTVPPPPATPASPETPASPDSPDSADPQEDQ